MLLKRQWHLVARILGFFQSLRERERLLHSFTPDLRAGWGQVGRICIFKGGPRKHRSHITPRLVQDPPLHRLSQDGAWRVGGRADVQGASPGPCRGSGALSRVEADGGRAPLACQMAALALMLKFRFNFQNSIHSLPWALNNISCLRRDGTVGECSDG